MGMLVGSVVISGLVVILIEIRRRVGVYAKNCLPLCTSCMWITVFLPLMVGAPVIIVYLGTSGTNYQEIASAFIGILSVDLMLGVTVSAIAVNYVFKQMDVERKAKFCVRYMRGMLSKIAVRSGEDMLRLLYDQYQLHGEDVLTETLKKGLVVFWWPVPDRDPDTRHNRILIDAAQYKKLKEIAEKTNRRAKDIPVDKPEEKKEPQRAKEYRIFCACCYESDGEDDDPNAGAGIEQRDEEAARAQVVRSDQILAGENVGEQPEGEENLIDFQVVLDRLKQQNESGNTVANNRGDPDDYMSGLYIQPYNALGNVVTHLSG